MGRQTVDGADGIHRSTTKGAVMEHFSDWERQCLLDVPGVGLAVVSRLEQIGICTLDQLAGAEVDDVLLQISTLLGATCWRNSPQARVAVMLAVALARHSPPLTTSR
jgi:nucleotidyltransferase/DNA polymerase involved in DNA repair